MIIPKRLVIASLAALFSSAVSVSVFAQDLSTLGNRTFLCVKRVGKTADGSKNRGRDAFMNPGPCPKGYFQIDMLGLAGAKSAAGPQGPTGPQGVAGPAGGVIFGRLISCQKGESEGPVTTPCDEESKQWEKSDGPNQNYGPACEYEVYAPGNSFVSRPDKSCMFRLSNVPGGTYDLVLGKVGKGKFVKSIKGVVVSDGTLTNVGDIPVCRDLDDDGFDVTKDCNDGDADINPGASEICDGVDNNCDGVTDEGCESSSSSSSSASSENPS